MAHMTPTARKVAVELVARFEFHVGQYERFGAGAIDETAEAMDRAFPGVHALYLKLTQSTREDLDALLASL